MRGSRLYIVRSATGGARRCDICANTAARLYARNTSVNWNKNALKRLPNLEKVCIGIKTQFNVVVLLLQANRKRAYSKKKNVACGEIKKGAQCFPPLRRNWKAAFQELFSPNQGERKRPQHLFGPAAKMVARPKSHATTYSPDWERSIWLRARLRDTL